MSDVTLESLAAQVSNLQSSVDQLLHLAGAAPQPTGDGPDSLPDPIPGEGIASYTARCGQFVGGPKGEHAVRAAGSMFLAGQYLVDKHDGSWKRAVWEFIMGDPAYTPDPAWQAKYPQG